jgi:predicted RNase H-like HicB family nuclease
MTKLNLKSVIWNEGKYYIAQCLNVDVSSFGKNKKEAMANLNEAVSLYFENEKFQNIVKVNRAEIIPFALRYA